MKFYSVPTSGVIPSTPVAWPNSNILAIATGRIVRIHTVDPLSTTGELIAVLEGHTASVTIVLSLPGMRIASASLDGTIRIWDVTTGQCLRTLDLANPILHMAYAHPEQLACLTATELLHVRLTRDRSKRRRQLVRKLLSKLLNKPSRVVLSESGSIAAVSDATNIHLTGLENGGAMTTLRCRRVVSALAITRDGKVLAVADEAGVISLYYNPEKMLAMKRTFIPWEKAAPTQLHWHASAPQALTFAHDDSVLISAGAEAVLVTWRLAPALLGTRTFLPRLRSAVFSLSISPDERTYAISQADNAVRLIDQVSSKVYRGIEAVPTQLLEFSSQNPEADLSSRVSPKFIDMCSLTADPLRRGSLWFAGTESSLELFDVFSGKPGEVIDVIPRNVVHEAAGKTEKMEGSSGVSGVAIHNSGRFLATVDSQELQSSRSERYNTERATYSLKFWYRGSPDKEFVLSALVSQPHGSDCSISSLCFHPSIPLLVTTSRTSRSFTLWRATRAREDDAIRWRKEIQCDYKEMACNDACFSSDGSILFVACEHVLTMWKVDDLYTNTSDKRNHMEEGTMTEFCPEAFPISIGVEFLHVLVHPPREEQIFSIAYAYRSVPLIISVTRNGIYAWHALSQSIWWSTRIRSASRKLAFDPESGRFAVQLLVPSIGADGENSDGETTERSTGDEVMDQTQPGDKATQISSIKEQKVNGAMGHEKQALHLRHGTSSGEGDSDNKHTVTGEKAVEEVASEAAVAIYDAGSPIPLHVHRLTNEARVTALAFVQHPGQTDKSTSTLVCVDSNMEVFLCGPRGNLTLTGATKPGQELKFGDSAPSSKLKNVLPVGIGEYRSSDVARSSKDAELPFGDCNILPHAIEKAFQRYFDGPTHVQAPAAVNSLDFIKTLLADGSGGKAGRNERALFKGPLENGDTDQKHHRDINYDMPAQNGNTNTESTPSQDHFVVADHKWMRTFCISAVRKAITTSGAKK